jgi:hypothetical protein
VLLEEQEYLIKQHKNHLNSVQTKDINNIDDRLKTINEIENQVQNLKENLYVYKDKLNQDCRQSS